MLQLNLTGSFLFSQTVLTNGMKRANGAIYNIASIASFMGRPNRRACVAGETGVLGLTRAMAADPSGKKIRVNAIAPGMIASPFSQPFGEAADTGMAWAQEKLIGRWGHSDGAAGAAVYLGCDESTFATGAEFQVQGG
jgi:NAD(P)-dependent dehydrogenase (short-subunit alcohol dehydrogenase family)